VTWDSGQLAGNVEDPARKIFFVCSDESYSIVEALPTGFKLAIWEK
jgi:hypothetical protein